MKHSFSLFLFQKNKNKNKKVYKFAFQGVKNDRIAFTSYPGTLWSGDDFYSMNDLAVVETTGEGSKILVLFYIIKKCLFAVFLFFGLNLNEYFDCRLFSSF